MHKIASNGGKMKKLITLTSLLLLIACGDDGGEKDNAPTVLAPIEDISVDLNQANKVIDLSKVFTDKDGDALEFVVEANSDENKVTATITGMNLTIVYKEWESGVVTIKVGAYAKGKMVEDEFKITITDNSTALVSAAGTAFTSGNYASAIASFTQLTNHKMNDVKAKAFVGLGFSQMRMTSADLDASYTAFSSGIALGTTGNINDLKAGLSFLEYSYKNNYTLAKTLASEVLVGSPDFEMLYDSKVNHKDVRLTLAQSYLDLIKYADCLTEVKALGKLSGTSATDSDLKAKLLVALGELATELRNN